MLRAQKLDTKEENPVVELPSDMLSVILGFLHVRDMIRFFSVDRFFNHYAASPSSYLSFKPVFKERAKDNKRFERIIEKLDSLDEDKKKLITMKHFFELYETRHRLHLVSEEKANFELYQRLNATSGLLALLYRFHLNLTDNLKIRIGTIVASVLFLSAAVVIGSVFSASTEAMIATGICVGLGAAPIILLFGLMGLRSIMNAQLSRQRDAIQAEFDRFIVVEETAPGPLPLRTVDILEELRQGNPAHDEEVIIRLDDVVDELTTASFPPVPTHTVPERIVLSPLEDEEEIETERKEVSSRRAEMG